MAAGRPMGATDDLEPLPETPAGRYRHYKGGEYQVTGVARHSETLEPFVVYRPLYNGSGDWVRPHAMFFGDVQTDGGPVARFTRVASGALAPLQVETPRLLLRQFTAADHPSYAALVGDPDVSKFLGTGAPMPPDIAWRTLSGLLGHWQMLGYGIYAVQRKEDGALVGQAGFIDVPGWPGFELAWMLGKAYWGQGYAREAAGAALRVARDALGRDRVISLIRPLNERSIRLAAALGAQREGTTDLLGAPAEVYVHARSA